MRLEMSTKVRLQHKLGGSPLSNPSVECTAAPVIRGERQSMGADLLPGDVSFCSLFESAPNAMFVTDEAGLIEATNEQASHMFGYQREELIGQPVKFLIPQMQLGRYPALLRSDHDKPPFRAMFQGVALSGSRKDGSRLLIELGLSSVQIGDTFKVINMVRDITQQRRKERELLKRDSEIQTLADIQSDLVVRIDPGLRFLYANSTAEKVFGLSRNALVGHSWTELTALSDMTAAVLPPVRQTLVDGQARGIKLVSKTLIGMRYFDVYLVPEYGKDGSIATVLIFGHDVTGKRNMTLVIHRTKTQISRPRKSNNFGSFEWNPVTGQRSWSDELFHIFGLEPGSLENTIETFMKMVHPEDRERIRLTWATTQTKGRPYQLEYRIVRPNGTECIIHECGYATSNDEGNFTSFNGYIFTKPGGSIPELKLPLERLITAADKGYSSHACPPSFPIVSDEEKKFLNQLQQPEDALTIPGDLNY